jgi:formate dehydrogenase iron-sulfur subunit
MACYAFSIDLDRCIGCQACVVACNTGNERPLASHYIKVSESVRGQRPNLIGSFLHHRCFHCADAACVTVCPTGTLSKWNGLTAVNLDKCSGCGYCTDACPYQVPTLVDGRVSKCVACLDRVQDGEPPWCVQTCPSQAIRFGERDELLAEAKARVAVLKARYPNAQVYGETQLNGLGLLMILLDAPSASGLPESPQTPAQLSLWQSTVQPIGIGLSALSAVVTGLLFIVARRQHQREKAMMHKAAEPAEIQGAPSTQPAAALLSGENTRTSQAASETATIVQPEKPAVSITGQAAVASHEGTKQPPTLHPKPPQPSERDEPAVTPSEKPASGKDDAKAPAPTTDAQPKLAGPSEEKDKKDK